AIQGRQYRLPISERLDRRVAPVFGVDVPGIDAGQGDRTPARAGESIGLFGALADEQADAGVEQAGETRARDVDDRLLTRGVLVLDDPAAALSRLVRLQRVPAVPAARVVHWDQQARPRLVVGEAERQQLGAIGDAAIAPFGDQCLRDTRVLAQFAEMSA